MTVQQIDFSLIDGIVLKSGGHRSPADGMCFLEAVSYVTGSEWTDHPESVCPVIGAFGRNWNDSLDEATRQRLKSYIPKVIGTGNDDQSDRRAWMCFDWLTRICAPAFMDLTPALEPHASALRQLPEITDHQRLKAANDVLSAAGDAAGAAARDAAGAAARDAAGDAAGAAARDAAWAAERDAALAAAGKTLQPVVKRLQQSAFELLDRMCDVGKQKSAN